MENTFSDPSEAYLPKRYQYTRETYPRRTNSGQKYFNNHSFQGQNIVSWRSAEVGKDCSSRNNEQFRNKLDQKTFMTVNSIKVGLIIGKQGSTIKQLERETGAKVSVGRGNSDGSVTVTITGSNSCQDLCKKKIEQLTELKYAPKGLIEDDSFPVIDWDAANEASAECERKRWLDCPPLKKYFYSEHPRIAEMDDEYVSSVRTTLNNITVRNAFGSDKEIPRPIERFEEVFHPYPEILEEIMKQRFEKPFPIQCQAWPVLLSGRDMIGIAQTGTGKTLAFLLPALIHTAGQDIPFSQRGGPNVLVLAPTRELAIQISKEVEKYSYQSIKSVCVYGGASRREQVREVAKGAQIIIATPGRLIDLIMAGLINIKSVTFLILDEADRMLDMGFEPQIRKILLDIRPDRQTVMTRWPSAVQNLAQKYMTDPIQVIVGSLNLAAVHSVKQTICIVNTDEKETHLMEFIYDLQEDDKVIIFVHNKALADSLSSDLILQNVTCDCIHGDREQSDREQAIDDLKTGSVRILIATDVASRGIDITDITKVLSYDFPRNIEEYVHRVGRTGRAGKTGEAVTFFCRNDSRDGRHAKELINILEEANQPVPEELYLIRDRHREREFKRDGRSDRRRVFTKY